MRGGCVNTSVWNSFSAAQPSQPAWVAEQSPEPQASGGARPCCLVACAGWALRLCPPGCLALARHTPCSEGASLSLTLDLARLCSLEAGARLLDRHQVWPDRGCGQTRARPVPALCYAETTPIELGFPHLLSTPGVPLHCPTCQVHPEVRHPHTAPLREETTDCRGLPWSVRAVTRAPPHPPCASEFKVPSPMGPCKERQGLCSTFGRL